MEMIILFISFLIYFAVFAGLWILLMTFKKGKDWFFRDIAMLLLRICALIVGSVFGAASVYTLFTGADTPIILFFLFVLTQICAIACFSLACITEN